MTASRPGSQRVGPSPGPSPVRPGPNTVNRRTVALYVGLHVACLGAVFTGINAVAIEYCLVSYFLRFFFLEAGYHRYFAHRAFKTSRAFQFVLGVLGALTVEKGPLWWAQTHRYHHRYSDTPKDIHSPSQQGFWYAYAGWFMTRHQEADLDQVPDLACYPELLLLERFIWAPVLLFAALTLVFTGWFGLLWIFVVPTVLVFHGTHWIQAMSHSVGGYRRFDTPDDSRNHWLPAILLLGEFHNNHHYRSSSARLGVKWWEFDVTFWMLKAMSRVGLVWSLRDPYRASTTSRSQ